MARGHREEEMERYRSAAESTLRQVEWCIAYLHRIRKSALAESIEMNRRAIQDRLRQEPPERTRS
jgi:hypothetical protein